MKFNPDPVKQAEFCFSHKWDKVVYPPFRFNKNDIQSANSQKHLGLVFDSKLDFNEHVNNKINKSNKSIGIMNKLSLNLSRNKCIYADLCLQNVNQYYRKTNTQTKHWNARGTSCHLVLVGNCPTCCHMSEPLQQSKLFANSLFQVMQET